jgi:hypothetical protein
MKKLTNVLMVASLCLSFLFTGVLAAKAATGEPSMQIVPKTKHYSRKTYSKGRYYTKTTWHNGKRVTKKVWYTSDRYGHKVAHKTKEVVMGKKTRRP